MNPRERERVIHEIVETRPIGTQGALVRALGQRGIEVTQATVSRDIRRLGLVKVRTPEGTARYAPTGSATAPPPAARRILQATLREFATELTVGGELFAIRTHSGCANAVAIALDEADLPDIVATLAGDDTILVLTRDRSDRARVLAELKTLMQEA